MNSDNSHIEAGARQARYVSTLTQQTLAVILAGGRGGSLGSLTDWRTKSAIPFGGKFRIIDFALSNCVNSQINRMLVLTQYKSHSLIKHIRNGWIQRKFRQQGSLCIVPAQQWIDDQTWYRGSADAIYQTMDIINSHQPEYVLVLNGEHVYSLDYGPMLAKHASTGADVTLCCTILPRAKAYGYGVVQADGTTGRVTAFDEMPDDPAPLPRADDMSLVSMGIYIFSRKALERYLGEDSQNPHSQHNLGRNIIPGIMASGGHIQTYLFRSPVVEDKPYWRDIISIDDYYEANMSLLASAPPLDLHHQDWPIRTHQNQLPPARFSGQGGGCEILNSVVSGGCRISRSKLDQSMLFSKVMVQENCQLKGVIALPGCHIGAGSRLTNVILDNRSFIGPGTVIGEDVGQDHLNYRVTDRGRVLISTTRSANM